MERGMWLRLIVTIALLAPVVLFIKSTWYLTLGLAMGALGAGRMVEFMVLGRGEKPVRGSATGASAGAVFIGLAALGAHFLLEGPAEPPPGERSKPQPTGEVIRKAALAPDAPTLRLDPQKNISYRGEFMSQEALLEELRRAPPPRVDLIMNQETPQSEFMELIGLLQNEGIPVGLVQE
jgi:hypothetical protein